MTEKTASTQVTRALEPLQEKRLVSIDVPVGVSPELEAAQISNLGLVPTLLVQVLLSGDREHRAWPLRLGDQSLRPGLRVMARPGDRAGGACCRQPARG
ncbi:MAG: hypothetical protein V9F03_00645 [Microthrixaceae bacterium]